MGPLYTQNHPDPSPKSHKTLLLHVIKHIFAYRNFSWLETTETHPYTTWYKGRIALSIRENSLLGRPMGFGVVIDRKTRFVIGGCSGDVWFWHVSYTAIKCRHGRSGFCRGSFPQVFPIFRHLTYPVAQGDIFSHNRILWVYQQKMLKESYNKLQARDKAPNIQKDYIFYTKVQNNRDKFKFWCLCVNLHFNIVEFITKHQHYHLINKSSKFFFNFAIQHIYIIKSPCYNKRSVVTTVPTI